ncbi:MAG: hypothetical protein MUD02_01095 [Bacteroidales bacterium]|jgi:hypothetical protein|nr:hypothetical protein [Bacteroidales bacterium]
MKKAVIAAVFFALFLSCKETEYSPEGPTDVRIRNSTGQMMSEITVNTSGGINGYGTVQNNELSDYKRFDKAFPEAEISTVINGQLYSTGSVDYNGMTYIGQAKITYVVSIKDAGGRTLAVDVILDAPLD